jgi:hypothetical protein
MTGFAMGPESMTTTGTIPGLRQAADPGKAAKLAKSNPEEPQ